MKRLTTAAICVAALTTTTVWAQREAGQQQGSQSQTGLQQPGQSSSSSTIQSGSAQGSISTSQGSAHYSATGRDGHGSQLRASKVIGADVKTSSGESLGKIEDIVLNPQSGRAEFAVISWESKLVPVPFKMLSASGGASASSSTTATAGTSTTTSATGMDRITFTAQIDRDKLQNAPTISDRSRWSELQQANFSQRINTHYGVSAVGAPGSDSHRESGTDSQNQEGSSKSRSGSSSNGTSGSNPGTSPSRTSP